MISFSRSGLALLSLLAGSLLLANEPEPTPTTPSQEAVKRERTITVQGTGMTEVVPDIIRLRIEVIAEESDSRTAKIHNDKSVKAALKTLDRFDVSREDISTSGVLYQLMPATKAGAVQDSFRVVNWISVTLREMKHYGALTTDLAKLPGVVIRFTEYDYSRSDSTQQKARLLAMEDARSKAKAMLLVYEQKLGRVLHVKEGHSSHLGSSEINMMTRNARNTPVEPGRISFEAGVVVTFEIVD